jgi:hypothetical protein
VLVRCNRRFERMLGLPAGAAAGATLASCSAADGPGCAAGAGGHGRRWARPPPFEAELSWLAGGAMAGLVFAVGAPAEPAAGEPEAVAVLTDITRLKAQQPSWSSCCATAS